MTQKETHHALVNKAVELAGEPLAWFQNGAGAHLGVDWTAEVIYIIDPDSPDAPVLEAIDFSRTGIDRVWSPEDEQESI